MIHRFVDLPVEVVLVEPSMIWNIQRDTGGTDRLFAIGTGGPLAIYHGPSSVDVNQFTIDKPEMSPDETEFVYVRNDNSAPISSKSDVMVVATDGLSSPASIAQVPSGAANAPSGGVDILGWSPDGQQVYYRGETNNTDRDSEIRVVGRDGTGNTLLWTSSVIESVDWGVLPRISRDGTMFAFWLDFDAGADMGLWVMDSDGTNMTKLYAGVSGGDFYGWSPDGEWLVFQDSNFSASPRWQRIFKIHPDGTGQTTLYNRQISGTIEPNIALSFGQYSVWLNDNSGIVCKKDTGSGVDPDFEIGILATDGSETFTALSPQRLMWSQGTTPDANHGPVMNQDGTRLYWQEGANLAAMSVVSAKPDGSDYRVDDDMDTDPSHDDYRFVGFHKRSSM